MEATDDIIKETKLKVNRRIEIKRANTALDNFNSNYGSQKADIPMSKNVSVSHVERLKRRETHISERRCRSLETSNDTRGI